MEQWDVYNAEGNMTGKVKTRHDTWNTDEYHLGASVWIVNKVGKVLIQKRVASKRFSPNKWGIAGGSVLSGETSAQGCIREAKEEVGILLDEGSLTFLQRFMFDHNIMHDDYAAFCDFPIEDVTIQTDEVSEVKWASTEEVEELFAEGLFMIHNLSDLDNLKRFMNTAPAARCWGMQKS